MPSILANFLSGVAATFVPLFLGLFVPLAIAKGSLHKLRLAMAVSSGIVFWFFLDVMNDAVLLDVNQGFSGGLAQALLVILFAASLLFLFGFERFTSKSSLKDSRRRRMYAAEISFTVALLVAVGIGFHAFGEGVEIGSLIPTASSMIDAIGGLRPGFAYAMHKVLEGFVIGVFAVAAEAKLARVLVLGLVAGVGTILGSLVALVVPLNSAFFFALGGAAVIYIEFKLIPSFLGQDRTLPYVVASMVGFYLMYLAGLFHG
jgi:ZIP family zinc transporter